MKTSLKLIIIAFGVAQVGVLSAQKKEYEQLKPQLIEAKSSERITLLEAFDQANPNSLIAKSLLAKSYKKALEELTWADLDLADSFHLAARLNYKAARSLADKKTTLKNGQEIAEIFSINPEHVLHLKHCLTAEEEGVVQTFERLNWIAEKSTQFKQHIRKNNEEFSKIRTQFSSEKDFYFLENYDFTSAIDDFRAREDQIVALATELSALNLSNKYKQFALLLELHPLKKYDQQVNLDVVDYSTSSAYQIFLFSELLEDLSQFKTTRVNKALTALYNAFNVQMRLLEQYQANPYEEQVYDAKSFYQAVALLDEIELNSFPSAILRFLNSRILVAEAEKNYLQSKSKNDQLVEQNNYLFKLAEQIKECNQKLEQITLDRASQKRYEVFIKNKFTSPASLSDYISQQKILLSQKQNQASARIVNNMQLIDYQTAHVRFQEHYIFCPTEKFAQADSEAGKSWGLASCKQLLQNGKYWIAGQKSEGKHKYFAALVSANNQVEKLIEFDQAGLGLPSQIVGLHVEKMKMVVCLAFDQPSKALLVHADLVNMQVQTKKVDCFERLDWVIVENQKILVQSSQKQSESIKEVSLGQYNTNLQLNTHTKFGLQGQYVTKMNTGSLQHVFYHVNAYKTSLDDKSELITFANQSVLHLALSEKDVKFNHFSENEPITLTRVEHFGGRLVLVGNKQSSTEQRDWSESLNF